MARHTSPWITWALLLGFLAMVPGAAAQKNSATAQAVLRIRVIVVPVVLPAGPSRLSAPASAVTFDLQRPRRATTTIVTERAMPPQYNGTPGQTLETTTVVPE